MVVPGTAFGCLGNSKEVHSVPGCSVHHGVSKMDLCPQRSQAGSLKKLKEARESWALHTRAFSGSSLHLESSQSEGGMSEGESGPQKGLLEPTQQEVTVDRDSTG